MPQDERKTEAFTLIELLVVIGLVLVLASLLLPVSNSILKKSQSAEAESNLRSMGTALAAHTSENNGTLLDGANGPRLGAGELTTYNGPGVAYWFNALDYYLGGSDYTVAGMKQKERPKWQRDPLKKYSEMTLSPAGYGISVGYGWNHQFFGYDGSSNSANGSGWATRMAAVALPSRTIIIGTGEDSLNTNNSLRNILIYANSIRCTRHNGGGFYLFLDGHVEQLTPAQVMTNDSYLMHRQK